MKRRKKNIYITHFHYLPPQQISSYHQNTLIYMEFFFFFFSINYIFLPHLFISNPSIWHLLNFIYIIFFSFVPSAYFHFYTYYSPSSCCRTTHNYPISIKNEKKQQHKKTEKNIKKINGITKSFV